MDKTGTVTKGKPELTDVIADGEEENFLRLVAAAEKNSEHPLAEAIVAGMIEKDISLPLTESFEAIPGFGIRASVEGKELLVGTRRLMEKFGADTIKESSKPAVLRLKEMGIQVIMITGDNIRTAKVCE